MPNPSPETQTLIVTERDERAARDFPVRGTLDTMAQFLARHAADARREGREEAALVVDQCNREGPYNAIGAAARIRALNDDTILGAARPAPPEKLHRRIAAARMVLGMSTLQTRFADRDGEWSLSALFNDIEAALSPIPPRPDQEELERQEVALRCEARKMLEEECHTAGVRMPVDAELYKPALRALVKALGGVR